MLKKPDIDGSGTSDVKQIIEDEIFEMLNLTSVDPNEIVVSQDRQGKLKTSNVSLDDILVKRCDTVEDNIVLFSKDGKIKPGVLVSTIIDKISTLDNNYVSSTNSLKTLDDEGNQFAGFQKSVTEVQLPIANFFGNPPVTTPKVTEIKTAISELASLQSRYEDHIDKFSTFCKNLIEKFFITTLVKVDIKLPDVK